MQKKTLKFLLAITASVALIFNACKKDEEDKDVQAANDNEEAEYVSNDALTKVDAATKGQNSFKIGGGSGIEILGPCATVTRDTVAATRTVIVDFGATNCLSADGRNRRGKIIMTFTGNYWGAGSVRTVTFDNYYVNDRHVEGTHSVTFNGKNASNHYTWTINAQNMKITRTDGKFHLWNSSRTREWMSGDNTLFDVSDDVYHISGKADGTNINGLSYSAEIGTPLKVAINCKWIESGTVILRPSGKPDRTLDFGNGSCDNQATVTIGKETVTITLN